MAKSKKAQTPKPADNTIYKIVATLLAVGLAAFLLHLVDRGYSQASGIAVWEPVLLWLGIGFAALTAAAVCGIIFGKGKLKLAGIFATVFSALFSICCFSLYKFWIEPVDFWYFLFVAGGVLYFVYLMYPLDFFLIATLATLSGGLFYLHGQKGYTSASTILLYVILALILAGMIFLTKKASDKNGKLQLGKKTLRLFSGKSAAMPLYFTCAVLLACMLASVILGSTFAFYCVYAAVGGLFVAACYYTIRLN